MAGIYVHIPFCHAKCAYCDFFSTPRMEKAQQVVQGIVSEYNARRHELADRPVRTIYFGGGTPSAINPAMLAEICSILPMHEAEEVTIEANPEDVTAESAAAWRHLGFNRVSMGVQSLVDSELAFVGRRHTAAEALSAIDTLRNAGFRNISCDLIYGLPGQTLQSWDYSLTCLLNTGIEHLSAYSLGYEPGTRLTAMLNSGKLRPVDDDIVAEMYMSLCAKAHEAGMEHYEISNFGKPDRHSLHNSSYWNGTPYLGLGPGAHSLAANGVRRFGPSDISLWLRHGAVVDDESDRDRINDAIVTGLRTSSGLDLGLLPVEVADAVLAAARHHIEAGHLLHETDYLRIPEEHWLVSDAIMRDLILI